MKLIQGVEDPDYKRVVLRLRQRFGPAIQHNCQPHTCFANAMSEETLVRNRYIQGPPISCNVFLTRCHNIHLCSETACTLYQADATGTCPLSSIQYGTMISHYDKNDSRTWYSRPYLEGSNGQAVTAPAAATPAAAAVAATPAPKRVFSDDFKKELASNVVRLLLWSPKRESRNTRVREQLTEEANAACSNYIQSQRLARQLPFWTDLFRIRGYMMSQQSMLQILQYDETLHDYYVAIICQVWDRVLRFRNNESTTEKLSRGEMEAVALGVLYGMRQEGYHKNGVTILAKDDFLAQELPPIQELNPHFNVERNLLTRGQKLFRQSFENAFNKNVAHSDIELDMAAITRAAASTVDPTTATVTWDARNRQVKITNKGEVLFMPVSRKKLKTVK